MLQGAEVEAVVPVTELSLAREFYEGVLGLPPGSSCRPDLDVVYELSGGSRLVVIEEAPAVRRAESAAHFVVGDVAETVGALRERGVEFDEFDLPELRTTDGIAEIEGRRFAWFRDPDGNVLTIHD